ncbi:hypothetical protein [Hathewaya massiliensis]|uniref:DUF7210 family protein n=1 Tax=Hathewaya massiliensis TaxID=1964382 RepID=UPI00163C5BCC|nr:hypothetical protein [Hathewaya massiliensis]
MAKKKEEILKGEIVEEEVLIRAKANVYLKYDKESYAIDEELKLRKEDAESMSEKGYVELLGEIAMEEVKEEIKGNEVKEDKTKEEK